MKDLEFQALIEAHTPIVGCEPTPDELHQFFWGQPLPTWFDRVSTEMKMEEERSPKTQSALLTRTDIADVVRDMHNALWQQNSAHRLGMDQLALIQALNAQPQERATPAPWVVQIQSGGQWFDIEVSGSSTEAGAIAAMERQLHVQPHLRLRVHQRG